MKYALLAVLGALATFGAAAQQLPYGPTISLEIAKKATAAAIEEARKSNFTMAVAVVDPAGNLVYFQKMDNTQNAASNIAIKQARASALFKRPTKAFQDDVAAGASGCAISVSMTSFRPRVAFRSSWTDGS